MKLETLCFLAGLETPPDSRVGVTEISSITCNSRACVPGCIFVCITGTRVDGHSFIKEALARGAVAIVTERDHPMPDGFVELRNSAVFLPVDDTREALARLFDAWYGHPARDMSLIAVTGTNGKTSVSTMLKAMFDAAMIPAGLIGTVRCVCRDRVLNIRGADENANIEELLNQLVESVVIAGGNIVPRVGEILGNIGTLLIENAPIMLEQGINQLTNFLLGLDSKAPDIIAYVGQLVVNMGGALLRSAPRLLGAAADLMFQLLEEIVHAAVDIGENLVKGFWKGIQNLAGWVRDKVKGFFKGIVDSVKNTLDIHSPSGESEWMAEMFAKGFAVGWDKNFPAVKKGIINDLDFGTASVNATANYDGKNGKFGGNGVIGKTVNVIQNIYSEAKTAADLMEETLYQQERAVLLGV